MDNVRIFGRDDESASFPARVDPDTGALITMDELRSEEIAGRVWMIYEYDESLANNGTIEVRLVNASHIHLTAHMGGDAHLEFFEDATFSADGTIQTWHNFNRLVGDTPQPTGDIYLSPTITADGTPLRTEYIPGGTGNNSSGGAGSSGEEFILDPAKEYLVRLTNISGQSQPATLHIIMGDFL